MKSLYILRHAKSDWPAGLDDVDRPLAPRGRKAAPQMGALMKARGYAPDLVLCSTARRTRETCALLLDALGERPVRYLEALYLASPAQLLRQIRQTDDEVDALLLVGHNPGVQSLALALAPEGDAEALAAVREKFSTGALAVLRLAAACWGDVAPGTGRLEAFVRPRDLA